MATSTILGAAVLADRIAWWENADGVGGSWVERTLASGVDGPFGTAVGDLDGDGDTDVSAPLFTEGSIEWWRNAAQHRAAEYVSSIEADDDFEEPRVLVPGDFDGDGDMDIAAGEWNGDFLCNDWRTPGGGAPPEPFGAVGDEITILFNLGGSGDSWLEVAVATVPGGVFELMGADVDRDGDLDLVGAAWYSGKVVWWENPSAPGLTWEERLVYSGGFEDCPNQLEVADFDGDGDLDVAVGDTDLVDTLSWWENVDGVGTSWMERRIANDLKVYRPRAGDMDGDGDLDLAENGSWWENPNDGSELWASHDVEGAFGASPVDVDGDGDVDLLGGDGVADELSWYENADGLGMTWVEHVIGNVVRTAPVVGRDLDRDGDIDVVQEDDLDGTWWENREEFGQGWRFKGPSGEQDVETVKLVDVDGDGRLDLVGTLGGVFIAQIYVWKDVGGHFSFETTDLAPDELAAGLQAAVLQVDLAHEGHPTDPAIEWLTLRLGFQSAPGVPLTSAEANALVETLAIHLDDGSGSFDPGDPVVASLDELLLDPSGVQDVSLPAGSPDASVAPGETKSYFVAVTATLDGALQTPNTLRLVHLPAEATALDATYDLDLEPTLDLAAASEVVTLVPPAPVLTLQGTCPGVITLLVSEAVPNGQVALVFSPQEGSTPVPVGNCAGTLLGLDSPNLLRVLATDADGEAGLSGPPGSCGFFLQTVDLVSCGVSDVVFMP